MLNQYTIETPGGTIDVQADEYHRVTDEGGETFEFTKNGHVVAIFSTDVRVTLSEK